MDHIFAYMFLLGISISQFALHRMAQRLEQRKATQAAIQSFHGGLAVAVVAHPITLDVLHEWLVHFFVYSGHLLH